MANNRNGQAMLPFAGGGAAWSRPWMRATNPLQQQAQPAASHASTGVSGQLTAANQAVPRPAAPIPRFAQPTFPPPAQVLPPAHLASYPSQPSQPSGFVMPWSQMRIVQVDATQAEESSQAGYRGGSAPDPVPPTQPSQSAARLLEELTRLACPAPAQDASLAQSLAPISSKLDSVVAGQDQLGAASGALKEGLAVQQRLIVGAEERLLAALQSVAANTQTLLDARQPPVTADMATQTTPPAALPPPARYTRAAQVGLSAAAPAAGDTTASQVPSARRKRSSEGLGRQQRPSKKAQPSHMPAVSLFSGLVGGGGGGTAAPSAPAAKIPAAAQHSAQGSEESDANDAASRALARRLRRHRQMLLRQTQTPGTTSEATPSTA